MTVLTSGQAVGLRPISESDVGERYLGWMNEPEVTRFLESRFETHTLESLRQFVTDANRRDDVELLAVVSIADGSHVGNVKIGPIDRHHASAKLGLLIGDRSCWGRGYGTEAIRLATDYSFERLALRKLTAGCYSGNTASAAAFRRAGWAHEGTRREQYVADDGSLHDGLLFGVLRASS